MRPRRLFVSICLGACLGVVSPGLPAQAAPDFINFDSDLPTGTKSEPFISDDSAFTRFSHDGFFGGSGTLVVDDFGSASHGVAGLKVTNATDNLLGVFSSDGVASDRPQDFICLSFGNDTGTFGTVTAQLVVFDNVSQFFTPRVGQSAVIANGNTAMDQRLCVNDIQFDLFEFKYFEDLEEVVDDIFIAACRTGATTIGTGAANTLNGTSRNNIMKGGGGNDTMTGGGCRDRLSGGDGNDKMTGGANNDVVSGLAGNDNIKGSEGRDVLTGGTGKDVLYGNSVSQPFDNNVDTFHTADGEVDTIHYCSLDDDAVTDVDGNDNLIDDCDF